MAVILGGVWGAVPTPFAASLGATHTLNKLAWLLGGQLVILVLGTGWLCAARNVIGLPDRLVPLPVRSRVRTLALFMPVGMAGGLVALGLPFLQTPWWLGVSLAGYTLAGAVWGILLPRLRLAFGVAVAAQRHLFLCQCARMPDTLQLAHTGAREAECNGMVATIESLLIALLSVLDLADTYSLYVVEDAAQAHGTTYACSSFSGGNVRYAGSMGDLGCFSLNGVKNMGGLGDGGMVTVSARLLARERAVADRLRGLHDLGRLSSARYVHEEWGMRARMDEFTALECLLELPELDAWNARRRAIAARYSAALAHSVIHAPITVPGRSHVFFNYAVRSPSAEVRERFERCLRVAGIEVAEAYTLVSDQRPYRTGRLPCRVEPLEVAREGVGLITHIPLYPELEEEEIERIVTALQGFSAEECDTVGVA